MSSSTCWHSPNTSAVRSGSVRVFFSQATSPRVSSRTPAPTMRPASHAVRVAANSGRCRSRDRASSRAASRSPHRVVAFSQALVETNPRPRNTPESCVRPSTVVAAACAASETASRSAVSSGNASSAVSISTPSAIAPFTNAASARIRVSAAWTSRGPAAGVCNIRTTVGGGSDNTLRPDRPRGTARSCAPAPTSSLASRESANALVLDTPSRASRRQAQSDSAALDRRAVALARFDSVSLSRGGGILCHAVLPELRRRSGRLRPGGE